MFYDRYYHYPYYYDYYHYPYYDRYNWYDHYPYYRYPYGLYSSVNQNINNLGKMKDVQQNAYVNQMTSRPHPRSKLRTRR